VGNYFDHLLFYFIRTTKERARETERERERGRERGGRDERRETVTGGFVTT